MASANGLIALLEEPQPELKKYALEQLDRIVPENWAEIAYSIQKVFVSFFSSFFFHFY
jgi:26S proteasome regulatory subunit N2